MTRQHLLHGHPALRFALVGASGFIVDTSVLILLFEVAAVDLLPARAIAFVIAASSNWILNRIFTFADACRAGRKSAQWLRFLGSAILSAIPNLGIFYLLMRILPEVLPAILFAMCCGILAGYVCNYQLAKHWVYRSFER
jgi:putative flippase GtrA